MQHLILSWLLLVGWTVADQPTKVASINNCLTEAGVPYLGAGSDAFKESIIPYNLRLPFTPRALAVPETVEQVCSAVSCGVANDATVSARGGGHSYISNGLGGEDGHLVVDMRKFNTTTVERSTGIATVGTGSLVGEVAVALYDGYGLAMAHGTCPSVGISGLTLHGGYGMSSRAHGLSLDNLVEAQVVLANSTVVVTSETAYPELFWALRGAGPSFGISTSFKFQTFAAPNSNIAFEYNLTDFNRDALMDALVTLQDYSINEQPMEMNMRVFWEAGNIRLSGMYHGELDQFSATMQPLLEKLGNPPSSTEPKVLGWIESLENDAYGPLLPTEPLHNTFFAKSLMPPKLCSKAISALVDYYFDNASHLPADRVYDHWLSYPCQHNYKKKKKVISHVLQAIHFIIEFYGGKTSAITQVPIDAKAYAHRNTIFEMQFLDQVVVAGEPYPSDGFGFLNGWVDAIATAQGMAPEEMGMYANYADDSLSTSQAHQAYWGENYRELRKLKGVFDPGNVFSNPQGIHS